MRPFLYTLDQISTLIQIPEPRLRVDFIHFDQRSVGYRPLDKMMARNIAPTGEKPEWRVNDRELARWLTRKGFKIYLRGWVNS